MMVSLDGFFEGPGHDLSWHHVDEEFVDFAIEQTKSVDTLLFGRRTYELMRDFWPTEQARKTDPETAELMNNTPKIVFSHSLTEVHETEYWKNVRLVKENSAEFVRNLKNEHGRDIAIFGSNNFCVSLMENILVDEFRIMINPVVIGKGTRLFEGIKKKMDLKLGKTRTFKNGNILLYYQPA